MITHTHTHTHKSHTHTKHHAVADALTPQRHARAASRRAIEGKPRSRDARAPARHTPQHCVAPHGARAPPQVVGAITSTQRMPRPKHRGSTLHRRQRTHLDHVAPHTQRARANHGTPRIARRDASPTTSSARSRARTITQPWRTIIHVEFMDSHAPPMIIRQHHCAPRTPQPSMAVSKQHTPCRLKTPLWGAQSAPYTLGGHEANTRTCAMPF